MADSAYTFYQIKISIFGLSQEEKTFCQKGTFINDETIFKSLTSIVKTRQANQWHHLPAYSCIKRGIAPGGGGVPCWGWGAMLEVVWFSTHASFDADLHH